MERRALNIIERGGINLVILREGTINVSAVNCFGDATALRGCYHRDKSPQSTVHAHANPAISGGTSATSYFFWTLTWLCWTRDWSDWRLDFERSFSKICWFVDWFSETSGWALSKTIGFPLSCKDTHSGLQNSNYLSSVLKLRMNSCLLKLNLSCKSHLHL